MQRKFFCQLLAGVIVGLLLTASAPADGVTIPADRQQYEWWGKLHAAHVEQMSQGNIDLLLIGDSITHWWYREPELFDRFFGEFNPINLGIAGDQTSHVLWRLDHLPLDAISPKVAMLMIGTNNIAHAVDRSPRATAEGIVEIVQKLQEHYPRMQIIVLHVFPRDEMPNGELRQRVNEINAMLPGMLRRAQFRGEQGTVFLANINRVFLPRNGVISEDIMYDFLHLTAEGYERWGNAVTPFIERAFQRYDRLERREQRFPRLRGMLR